jgi:hypothetical protein
MTQDDVDELDRDLALLIRLIRAHVDVDDPPELGFGVIDKFLRRFKTKYDLATDLNERRRALGEYILCLSAVINAHTPWRRAGLAAPLHDLKLALDSLEAGAVEPLLQPAPGPGRPRMRSRLRVRAYGAAASAILMRAGWTEKSADKWAAKMLCEAGYTLGGERSQGITAGTIKGWRKECREAPARDLLRLVHDGLLSIVPADFDGEEVAKNWAVQVIQTLFRMDGKAPPVEPCRPI